MKITQSIQNLPVILKGTWKRIKTSENRETNKQKKNKTNDSYTGNTPQTGVPEVVFSIVSDNYKTMQFKDSYAFLRDYLSQFSTYKWMSAFTSLSSILSLSEVQSQ